MPNLTEKLVQSLKPSGPDTWYWDDRLKGFAVRVLASGKASYYVKYRLPDGRSRKHCIGPTYPIKCDQARRRAEEIIAAARNGTDLIEEDSKRSESPTVADLYRVHRGIHRPPTIREATYKTIDQKWRVHILPNLGSKKVADLTGRDISTWFSSIKGKGAANNSLNTLAKALNDCEKFSPPWRPKNSNPCHDVKKHRSSARDRILDRSEFVRFLRSLSTLKANKRVPVEVLNLFMLLLVTGLRLRELMNSKWSQYDGDKLRLTDTKNGKPRTVRLSDYSLEILDEIRRLKLSSEFVFPNEDRTGPRPFVDHYWRVVRDHAELVDFHIHDLRHTAASYGHQAGLSVKEVSNMLGHSSIKTTTIYLNTVEDIEGRSARVLSDTIRGIAALAGEELTRLKSG